MDPNVAQLDIYGATNLEVSTCQIDYSSSQISESPCVHVRLGISDQGIEEKDHLPGGIFSDTAHSTALCLMDGLWTLEAHRHPAMPMQQQNSHARHKLPRPKIQGMPELNSTELHRASRIVRKA
jgi:hypothetical protein